MTIRRLLALVIILFSVVPTLLVAGVFTSQFVGRTQAMFDESIAMDADGQAGHVADFMSQRITDLRLSARQPAMQAMLAAAAGGAASSQLETMRTQIQERLAIRQEEQPYLHRVYLVDKEGQTVASGDAGEPASPSTLDAEALSTLMRGEPYVGGIRRNGDIRIYPIAYPVRVDGQVAGAYVFEMNVSNFQDMAEAPQMLDSLSMAVLDGSGNVVATDSRLTEGAENIAQLPENTLFSQLQEVYAGDSPKGVLEYRVGTTARLAYYVRVSDTGWLVLCVVDKAAYMAPIRQTLQFLLVTLLFLFCTVVIVYQLIARYFSAPVNRLLDVIGRMRGGEETARYPDGKDHEFGEIGRALNELMDKISADRRELALKEERYRIVSEQTDNVIYEYDASTQSVAYSSRYEQRFGFLPADGGRRDQIGTEIICPDDLPACDELHRQIRSGKKQTQAELRLRTADRGYIWCRIQATSITDETGRLLRVVGSITDIDREKKEKERLLRDAQRDVMTGVFNKATAERRISQSLAAAEPGQMQALLCFDIDDFKQINDRYGHLFGDEILREIARRTLRLFEAEGFVGRFGGDEFVVFLQDVSSREMVEQRAEQLTAVFYGLSGSTGPAFSASGSIGIALYPQDGETFRELYANADHALYAAKMKGKNGYAFYDPAADGALYVQQARYSKDNIDRPLPVKGDMASYIFHILYESADIEAAIPRMLEVAGRYYHVSRAYVFENSEDGRRGSNTFEWCGEGVEPEIDRLQDISYEETDDYLTNFDDNGLFYCSDTAELSASAADLLAEQGIQAVLQCAIMNDGVIRGFVGFDECRENRLWTKEEIDTLSFVARILSIFLIKMRMQQELERTFALTTSVLDTQDLWTYVIDRQTYELLFINRKTHEIAPHAKVGDRCYAAFFGGRQTPCEHCPMRDIPEGQTSCTLELYNRYLHVWTSATASLMDWAGRAEVCLLCCIDISAYKEGPPDEE